MRILSLPPENSFSSTTNNSKTYPNVARAVKRKEGQPRERKAISQNTKPLPSARVAERKRLSPSVLRREDPCFAESASGSKRRPPAHLPEGRFLPSCVALVFAPVQDTINSRGRVAKWLKGLPRSLARSGGSSLELWLRRFLVRICLHGVLVRHQ